MNVLNPGDLLVGAGYLFVMNLYQKFKPKAASVWRHNVDVKLPLTENFFTANKQMFEDITVGLVTTIPAINH